MRRMVLVLCLAVAATGCRVRVGDRPTRCPGGSCPAAEVPTVNVPPGGRVSNYAGGSCVFASIETLFYWQGRADLATRWRSIYSGGETSSGLEAKLEAEGVRFAQTTSGDAAFLEWAIRTRRGAAVSWPEGHMVCLVHLDAERAGVVDNNRTSEVRWTDRRAFEAKWRECGGWAATPVYSPSPPPMWRRAA